MNATNRGGSGSEMPSSLLELAACRVLSILLSAQELTIPSHVQRRSPQRRRSFRNIPILSQQIACEQEAAAQIHRL